MANNEIGNFEPDFSSGNLYFADADGTVQFKDENGEQNWESELRFFASGVAAGFGIVVISDIKGNVIALNINDGSELWSTNVKSEILSKVAIDAKL